MPTKKNTTKTKPIKRTVNNCYPTYIPQAVRNMGITKTFLDDAVGCYLDFRKEPEKLLTRNLNSDWNFHMFRDAVCKVVSVEARHDVNLKSFRTQYEMLENTGLKLPHWHPSVTVGIDEHVQADINVIFANICITNHGHAYTYESRDDRWIVEFERRQIMLPKEPFGKISEIHEESVPLTSGLAWRLNNIHRLVKIQHPEFA